ncbi:serine O-acetyltransferase [Priestia aryabhattai]|uniref:serine O-acetyltransferase n=1 Tax=Priestia aryabhattai TaxID=412384 RepID=UPI0015F5DDDF|nr:serine acetyltransferase [Priestia aryabhattai]
MSFLRRFMQLGGFHGVIVMSIYKTGNFIYYRFNIPILKHLLFFVYLLTDYFIVRTVLGCEFPAKCKIGKNIRLPHGGKGIIIEKSVVIGDNVTLFHQVTLGINKTNESPIIGNGVFIGTGAKILGSVTVGDNSKIGANAVVIKDVPPNSTAVGIPASVTQNKKIVNS